VGCKPTKPNLKFKQLIRIFNNSVDLSQAAAQVFVEAAMEAVEEKGSFYVALTGGSSPLELYRLLGSAEYREKIPWEKVFVFWGDERWVDLEDERSNAKLAFDSFLDQIPIPKDQIFPMWEKGANPADFAQHYEQLLQHTLGIMGIFDLILLGMGEDGHTASLFPHTPALHEQAKWVDAYYLENQGMYRITLTFPTINRAKQLLVIVQGEKKAEAIYEVLEGKRNPDKYPAQLIQPLKGEVLWLLDKEAASKLSPKS
jgi:6-phosphogluconolactonase